MTTRPPRPRRGMTLIELIVAMAITGMTLTVGYGALSWMAGARRRTNESTDALWRAAAVRRTIEGWLAGATLAVSPDIAELRGLDGVRARLDDDEITFRTTAPTPLGTPETIVTLTIDHETETSRGLVARFAEPHGARRGAITLEPRAVGLDARYLSGVSGAARWSTSWISSSVLPRGIALTLTSASGDSLPAMLRLPIVVALSSGM